MIVCVHESCQDDSDNVLFVDMDKLTVEPYKAAILAALEDSHNSGAVTCENSFSYGDEDIESALVGIPCLVGGTITLYVD